jgi:hypothetical protein
MPVLGLELTGVPYFWACCRRHSIKSFQTGAEGRHGASVERGRGLEMGGEGSRIPKQLSENCGKEEVGDTAVRKRAPGLVQRGLSEDGAGFWVSLRDCGAVQSRFSLLCLNPCKYSRKNCRGLCTEEA